MIANLTRFVQLQALTHHMRIIQKKKKNFEKKTTLINILDSIAEEIETESPKDEKRNEYVSEIDIIRRAIDGPVLNYGFSGQKF